MEYDLLFRRLDERLAEENIDLEIFCIGGFVLEYHSLKATCDIDAFYESNDKIDQIIREVGDEYKANMSEAWLNNNIQTLMSKPTDPDIQWQRVFNGQYLKAYIASLENVLIDKTFASRQKDIEDMASILRQLNMKHPTKMFEALIWSEGEVDPRVVFEAYVRAFGEDELLMRLQENPELERVARYSW